MASQERPSPAFSDGSTTNVSDEHLSSPSSPSTSLDSAPQSDASAASSLLSDGSSGADSKPVVSRKPRPPQRSWPDSDEIAILEAVASHRQKHGRLPSPADLAAALRGRIRAEDRLTAEQVAKRLRALRSRYDNAATRLKRGIIPAKDGDVTIYKLSKLIWADARKGKREKREKKTRAPPDTREDPREFGELTELYPCLSAQVEAIDARCGYGSLKRAFGRIGDDTAARLEAKLKRQLVAEARASAKLDMLRTNVAKELQRFLSEW